MTSRDPKRSRSWLPNVRGSILLLLLSVHLYSALSLQIPNALHVLCQYLANRKHLSDRLK